MMAAAEWIVPKCTENILSANLQWNASNVIGRKPHYAARNTVQTQQRALSGEKVEGFEIAKSIARP